ncbi:MULTISPECIES: ABC transporter ATP-binding protein [Mesorhizobium]|uniref:Peptide ABC transporter ATP-binding protein n=2 Tax=Mesorhizobium TaxID=68287 RepID=A0A1A5HRB1_RHILI|nr:MULTISPECIES: ABC transporter ATP-binding protein [Mesorhizobium]ETA71322.1 oligopeptide/dipeptide ABC transporter, ATP-binding protein [Mesorhizobium japonicum R7A]MBE1711720.1 ABC transporter ATP-binding protein [Mesorhizobium japonicum]MBE1717728.1 ABC transporter ATP-binding protein [Mesorhizobium japonicum]MUT23635.1 ATP-binding cassette domain-containing protein [Mesorhizobium japonicum]MUT30427.1 ATP-binding cassette domain-containing protein [Mesorhizobium japonicum]
MTAAPLLSVEDLTVNFPIPGGWFGRATSHVHAVNKVDLTIRPGESLGIVGESGCGKSTLVQAIIGLVERSSGKVVIDGQDFHEARGRRKREIRQQMQIVFQDPQSSLNPRLPVWRLITEPLHVRGGMSKAALRARAAELAASVGLRPEHLDRRPHEFSGGQRQRIAVARAISTDPDLLILDEPTSALDVSVQAQIINLLLKLQRELGLAYLMISHDVSLVRHFCDRVAVMYLGQIVEAGPAVQVLDSPAHPYTRTLLATVPSLKHPLPELAATRVGELPNNRILPTGCYYRDRCSFAAAGCDSLQPLVEFGDRAGTVSMSPPDKAAWPRSIRCHRAQAGDI